MLSNNTMPYSVPVAPINNSGNGMFGGDGWWAIIIFALIFGWGRGGIGGFGGESGNSVKDQYILSSDFATLQRQLSDGFNAVDNALDRQNAGICDLGYTALSQSNQTNTNILTASNAIQTQLADCCCKTQQNIKDTQYAIATASGDIRGAIKDCCCDTEKQFMQTRFDAAQYNCNTLQAIDKLGDRIIDYMNADKTQALRDENQALRLAASQQAQNNYLVQTLRPFPVASYNVPNPYVSTNYCGCNGCGNYA